jgi:organic radical activating enzyme
MLSLFPNSKKHLNKKISHIVITNVCNLSCGGCHQHCGNFEKEQLWFISKKEFIECIKILKNPQNRILIKNKNFITKISIFGGEPTLHPQWKELVEVMELHGDVLFRVSTNGRLAHEEIKKYKNEKEMNIATLREIIKIEKSDHRPKSNINYIIDPKDEYKIQSYKFVPTMIAPIDVYPNKNKKYFWKKAQRDCGIWKNCSKSIYNGKAYFCEVAASMDWLFYNGQNGWDLNDNLFDKSIREIEGQAEKFCHRCAWCIKTDPVMSNYVQKISDPTLVSETNKNFPKNDANLQLVQIEIPNLKRK